MPLSTLLPVGHTAAESADFTLDANEFARLTLDLNGVAVPSGLYGAVTVDVLTSTGTYTPVAIMHVDDDTRSIGLRGPGTFRVAREVGDFRSPIGVSLNTGTSTADGGVATEANLTSFKAANHTDLTAVRAAIIATNALLAAVDDNSTGTLTNATGSGSVTAYSIHFTNVGEAAATVGGGSLPAGATVSFHARISASVTVSYDATGTELLIAKNS